MDQQKPRASPADENAARKKRQVTQDGKQVLRAHDLIFTANGIIPKYIRQWR